jgi:antirestriction protein ArdC
VNGFIPATVEAPPVTIIPPIEQAEAFVAATGAIIHHGGGQAYYRPSTDSIQLPPRETFIGTLTSTPEESYYSTLCHELTHNAEPSVMPRRSGFARKNASKPALPFGIIRAIQETRGERRRAYTVPAARW